MSEDTVRPLAGHAPAVPLCRLRLFVAGEESNSEEARKILARLCASRLHDCCDLRIVDVYADYTTALENEIVVIPTVIVESPPPVRAIVGSLGDEGKAMAVLGLTEDRDGRLVVSETGSSDELQERLTRAEAILEALRRGEVDLVIGPDAPMVVCPKTMTEEYARLAGEWQAAFDAVKDVICILDVDQRVVRCNQAAERFLQRPDGSGAGKYCWEIFHGTTAPIPECPFPRMRQDLQRASIDMKINDRPFEVTVDPILDGEGRLTGAVHIVSDISGRIRTEEQLRLKSERLSLLLEIGTMMAGPHDTAELLQMITDGAARLSSLDSGAIYLLQEDMLCLGATTPALLTELPEEVCTAPLLDHPHIRRAVQTGLPVVLADCREADMTDAERHAADLRGLRSVLYLPLALQNQSLGVLIVGTTKGLHRFSDEDVDLLQSLAHHAALELEEARLSDQRQRWIEDLERLSELQRQTQTALQESEALFRSLFLEHAAVKLLINPDDGRIVDANKAAAEFYGWSREELSRMKMSDLNTLSPDQLKAAMETVKAREGVYFEFKHLRADGLVRDVAVYSSRIEAGGKDLLHSIVHDITDRKRAEERMAEQLGELQRWHAVMVDRERRVLELKREINEMLARAGQPPRYPSAEAENG